MTTLFEYNINDVRPYINWVYFYHAWGLSGKPASEKAALRSEAETILAGLGDLYHTHAVFGLFPANSDGDDIIINGVRLPFLRQQTVRRMVNLTCAWQTLSVLCRPEYRTE